MIECFLFGLNQMFARIMPNILRISSSVRIPSASRSDLRIKSADGSWSAARSSAISRDISTASATVNLPSPFRSPFVGVCGISDTVVLVSAAVDVVVTGAVDVVVTGVVVVVIGAVEVVVPVGSVGMIIGGETVTLVVVVVLVEVLVVVTLVVVTAEGMMPIDSNR